MTLLAASNVGIALIAAAASLIGTIVGGLVTGGVALKAEEKRQTFAREMDAVRRDEEQEGDRRKERAAARLVHVELIKCRAGITTTLNNRERAPDPLIVLPEAAREAHSEHLALRLPSDVWGSLQIAYSAIEAIRHRFSDLGTWPDDQTLKEYADDIEDAEQRVAPYATAEIASR